MKVFRVIPAPSCPAIVPENAGFLARILPFDCQRKAGEWESFGAGGPSFRLEPGEEASSSDFFAFHPGVLAYDEAVAEAADREELFANGCEWLPARLGARILNFLNITDCYNCLDVASSEFESDAGDGRLSIVRHAFYPERILDSTLFKIPQTKEDAIYCLSGRGDGDLKQFCETYGFSGLLFQEVWSA